MNVPNYQWNADMDRRARVRSELVRIDLELDRRTSPRELSDEEVLGSLDAAIPEMAIPTWGRVIKRAMDIVGAGAALIMLSPLLGVVAALVKFTSPGPVFFGQPRITLGGREFRMYKFRTMVVDAEAQKDKLATKNEMSGPAFKIKNDPRVTRVGRFLRKHSIDELPQLWNVLNGDLSLVGPRPTVPREVVAYKRWQARRMQVKAGLTCIWQVSGRNRIEFVDWMRMDIRYINEWSVWMDIKLLFKTVKVVITGDGAS